jgi:hypothetical protein
MEAYRRLSENILRQFIDACAVYEEYRRVDSEASRYMGGMYWKVQGPYEYLVRTAPDNTQTRLGPRSDETEHVYVTFKEKKAEVETRLRHLWTAVKEAARVNTALRVGRVPSPVVDFLVRLDDAGVAGFFTIVGLAALFAYETRAGVRFSIAGSPVGKWCSLAGARDGIQVLVDMPMSHRALLEMLQLVDESFCWKTTQPPVAVNDHAFEVECLCRPTVCDESTAGIQSNTGNRRLASPGVDEPVRAGDKLEQIIVGSNGRMAVMRTLPPERFIQFMTSAVNDSRSCNPEERRRMSFQIDAVQILLDDNLLST